MKPFDYYSTTQVPWPNKRDYTILFVYDKGACVFSDVSGSHTKSSLKEKYPTAVIQEVFDREAYNAQILLHDEEASRLHMEFQQDLFEDYGVSDNPKRFKCFALAWERGHSSGHSEVYYEFGDLVALIRD